MIYLLAIALLLSLGGCASGSGFLGLFGGGAEEPEAGPPPDMGAKVIDVLPELVNSGAYLLSTFVYTAVVVAIVFRPARAAAIGVFIAFYDRIAFWFKPKEKKG